MKNIVVPVDFSSASINACYFAESLSAIYDSISITILNVYHIPVIDPMMPQTYLSELAESSAKQSITKLEELKAELEKISKHINSGAVDITIESRLGFAVDEILDYISELNPDMVITGTRHSEGFRILSGSIASKLVDKVEIPLIVVPERYSPRRIIDNILYASNFDKHDELAIDKLLEIAKPIGAQIHCLHVHSHDEELKNNFEALKEKFKSAIDSGFLQMEIIESDNTEEVIAEYTTKNHVDLLAMLTHKKSFLDRLFEGSFTKRVAFHTDKPILIFH